MFVSRASAALAIAALTLSSGAAPAAATSAPQQMLTAQELSPLPVPGIGQPNNQLNPNRGHFSLGILQGQAVYPELIARISLKSQRPNAYLQERLVGDFRYRANQRAQFIRGLNPGDRVVVRLFTPQNSLIGYSEFELLEDFSAVHLVLPSQSIDRRLIRTVYGIDADQDFRIDGDAAIYEYFTEVTGTTLGASRVTFLSRNPAANTNLLQVQSLPAAADNSVYTESFQSGTFALDGRTIAVFSTSLAPALTALPGQLVQITNLSNSQSIYEVSRLILAYREVGVSEGSITQIEDAPLEESAGR